MPIAACAAAIACGLPIEGDCAGACAGCGCAHAPSSKAAKSTIEVLAIILLSRVALLQARPRPDNKNCRRWMRIESPHGRGRVFPLSRHAVADGAVAADRHVQRAAGLAVKARPLRYPARPDPAVLVQQVFVRADGPSRRRRGRAAGAVDRDGQSAQRAASDDPAADGDRPVLRARRGELLGRQARRTRADVRGRRDSAGRRRRAGRDWHGRAIAESARACSA